MASVEIDLDDLIPAEADEGHGDAASEAGLTGSDEESQDIGDQRNTLSELAAVDGETETDDGAEEDESDEEEEFADEDEVDDLEPDADDPEDDDEPSEQESELSDLKALVLEERETRKRLEQQLLQQQQPETRQAPQPQQPDPQFVGAVRALMLGGDPEKAKETLGRLPPHVVDGAVRFVRDANERMVHYEIQPERRYFDQFAPLVAQQIAEALKPYRTDRYRTQARDVLSPFQDVLKDDADRKGVMELLSDMPGDDLAKRVKYAVELHLARKGSKKVVEKTRKLADKTRDLKAQKASRRRTGKRRGKKGKKVLPQMDSFNAGAFADSLKGLELDPSDWEGVDFG